MRSVFFLAALASSALVSAFAIPEPQDASLGVPCGCTNDCIIGCAGKPDCFCPQYCDPKYECPPSTTRAPPTKTTTTIKPTFTCGCTNDCKIACGNKPNCICPLFCDPKYLCPTTRPTKTTTSAKPTFTCGCLNDCIVACKEPPCACPKNCDPKYACTTLVKYTTTTPTITTKPSIVLYSLVPVPAPTTTGPPCGCFNDCTLACPKGKRCVCPAFCDPKYECKTAV